MKSPIQLVKEEIAERYGISTEQIRIELSVDGLKKETSVQILKDYANYPTSAYIVEDGGHTSGSDASGFYWIHAHTKKEVKENA